jgi:xanthine dehydrogenase molybdenum-binding subunit
MPDESSARITIAAPDKADGGDIRVIIDHGWTEMGQGVNTVAVQVVCEETGLPPGIMEVVIDTSAEQIAGMTTASRATSLIV